MTVEAGLPFSALEGAARERALDKMREWNTDHGWWQHTREDLANNVLPDEWCITGVNHKQMWFDLYRGQTLALTDGRVDLKKLMEKKPDMFSSLAIRTAIEKGWLYDPHVYVRNDDTRGVDGLEWNGIYTSDLANTPFDGMDADTFYNTLIEPELDDLQDALSEWVKDAANACLNALQEEYDYLGSDEACEQMAENYTFDEDGEVI